MGLLGDVKAGRFSRRHCNLKKGIGWHDGKPDARVHVVGRRQQARPASKHNKKAAETEIDPVKLSGWASNVGRLPYRHHA